MRSRSVAEGWGEFGVVDPGVCVLSPCAPLGFGRGRFELCALPHPRFLTTGGAELCCLPEGSGLSDVLGELANGYDRVESRSIVRDGVGIALL